MRPDQSVDERTLLLALCVMLDHMVQPAAIANADGALLASNERWQRLMPQVVPLRGRSSPSAAAPGRQEPTRAPRVAFHANDSTDRPVLLVAIPLPAEHEHAGLQLLLIDRRRSEASRDEHRSTRPLNRRHLHVQEPAMAGGMSRHSHDTSRSSRTLTPRERQVAMLIAAGRRNAEIATALGMQPSTARRHTERILQKLGVSNRAAAAALLAR